jgi:N-acetylglucosamine kinase
MCADVGGSYIDIAMIDQDMSIHHRTKFPTPTSDWDRFVDVFRQFRQAHSSDFSPQGDVALAVAGLPAPDSGRVVSANIACMNGRRLAHDLGQELGGRVSVINDADAFVLGEAQLGAAKGHRRVMGIILGTGVGGGLIEDGKVITGAHGIGGEWGHGQVIVPSPKAPDASPLFPCGCGRKGCLDTLGSARGLERLHHFLHGRSAISKEITTDFARGDAHAVQTVDYFTDIMAGSLSIVLNAFPATSVPVGGGLSNCAPLVAELDRKVRDNLLEAPEEPLLVATVLGGDAGLLGAYFAADL